MNKIIIAIDGYSSTGKSTVARQLADYLNYIYVDSGAMYRAVALFALQNNYLSENHFDKQSLNVFKIAFRGVCIVFSTGQSSLFPHLNQ